MDHKKELKRWVDEQERCGNCRFWSIDLTGCRRHAPTILSEVYEATAIWPFVLANDWCGDYEPKEKRDE